MGGDAVFRHAVHFPCADLHLERERNLAPADDGRVQRLVHVGLGDGDIILEPAGHLVPQGVDNAEHGVAVGNGIHDDADGHQVVNLVEGLLLEHHLPVNGIEVLGPAVDIIVDMLLVQPLGQFVDDQANALLPLGPLLADQVDDPLVAFRIDILEGKIFQLLLDGVNAEAVRQRRVDIQGFPGDCYAAVFRLETEGAHVVQAVRQLDQHDADIPGHGKDHLAQGFGLGLLPVGKVQFIQLGDAVHQVGDFLAEFRPDGFQRDAFAVFHRIVQEAGRNRGRVDHEIRQDGRDKAGVRKIRLPGLADLPVVGLFSKMPRPFDKFVAVPGVILLYPVQHLVQRHGFVGCEGHGPNPPFSRYECMVKSG